MTEREKRAPKLLTMPAASWEALDALCASRGMSRGQLVQLLVHGEELREIAHTDNG